MDILGVTGRWWHETTVRCQRGEALCKRKWIQVLRDDIVVGGVGEMLRSPLTKPAQTKTTDSTLAQPWRVPSLLSPRRRLQLTLGSEKGKRNWEAHGDGYKGRQTVRTPIARCTRGRFCCSHSQVTSDLNITDAERLARRTGGLIEKLYLEPPMSQKQSVVQRHAGQCAPLDC